MKWADTQQDIIQKTMGLDTEESNAIVHWRLSLKVPGNHTLWVPIPENEEAAQFRLRRFHVHQGNYRQM